MNNVRIISRLIIGILLTGFAAFPVFADSDIHITQEQIPDTSELKSLLPKSRREEERPAGRSEKETAASVHEDSIEIGTVEFTRKLLYTTFQQEDSPLEHLNASVQLHGDSYILVSAESPVVVKQEEIKPTGITFTSEVFTGDPSEHAPEEYVEREGVKYRLKSKELIDGIAEERSKHQEKVIRYQRVEAGVVIPEEKAVEFTDIDTQQTVQAVLQLTSKEVVKEYWSEDFEFPITITGYDADTFLLDGKEIPGNADLMDYQSYFLDYLKLDADYYSISEIIWNGEAYENNGNLVRNAIAKGSKFVRDIDGVYAGVVQLPAISGKMWNCVYEEEISEDRHTLYTMAAEATYRLENVPVKEKGLFEKIRASVVGIVTAAYEAVLSAIEEHRVLVTIPLILVSAFAAFLIGRKRKQFCIYNKKDRCIYGKHKSEQCDLCDLNIRK